jgi:proteasome lid subunit RPN8/RPN11
VRYTGAATVQTPPMPIPWAAEVVTKPGQLSPPSEICTVLSAPWPTRAYVHHRAWETIRTESTWRSAADLCETGGYLVGTDLDVLVSTGPGPNALREPERFAPDPDYCERLIRRLQDTSLRIIGEWHVHLSGSRHLSDPDLARYTIGRRALDLQSFLSVIVVPTEQGWQLAGHVISAGHSRDRCQPVDIVDA